MKNFWHHVPASCGDRVFLCVPWLPWWQHCSDDEGAKYRQNNLLNSLLSAHSNGNLQGTKVKQELAQPESGLLALHSFPVVFQSRTWSRGFALFMLCSGFCFLGEGLTSHWVLPNKVVESRCSGSSAGRFQILIGNYMSVRVTGTALHKLLLRTLTTAVTTARIPLPARMRAFTSAQRVVSCFKMNQKIDLKWRKEKK